MDSAAPRSTFTAEGTSTPVPPTRSARSRRWKRCRLQMVAPDYRRAPEFPFPAAVDDAVAVYRALLAEGISSTDIVFAGDSAGGGLALACMLAARRSGLPVPAAGILFSPWTDLAVDGTITLWSSKPRRRHSSRRKR